MRGTNCHSPVNDVANVWDNILNYLEFRVKEIQEPMDSGTTKNVVLSQVGWLVKDADTRYFLINKRKV